MNNTTPYRPVIHLVIRTDARIDMRKTRNFYVRVFIERKKYESLAALIELQCAATETAKVFLLNVNDAFALHRWPGYKSAADYECRGVKQAIGEV
jgi:hypothetical protein